MMHLTSKDIITRIAKEVSDGRDNKDETRHIVLENDVYSLIDDYLVNTCAQFLKHGQYNNTKYVTTGVMEHNEKYKAFMNKDSGVHMYFLWNGREGIKSANHNKTYALVRDYGRHTYDLKMTERFTKFLSEGLEYLITEILEVSADENVENKVITRKMMKEFVENDVELCYFLTSKL
jgi:predicted hydrocarbon binding protein